ncbi:polyadenylate-binding protein-interacting protein 1 [Coccinella septempunctata]|uniref:polyadenylate-binding protein-interacting protein 1 n=1 Tax=Coccinella septempunctata TaxID=41139 RepID=UPI001D080F9E|nr:polyadenylate-binding protein-interacting protein 1 [Coccinella septempunctata]
MEDKPLWDPNRKGQILRAPRTVSNVASNNDNQKSSVSSTSIVPPEKSKLNAAAAEFIPKCFYDNSNTVMSKPPQLSVQNRLKIHKDQELQRNQASRDGPINARLYSQGDNNFRYANNSLDDRRLKQLINTLTCDPGQFDSLLDIFRQTLKPYFEDIIALASVTDLLVSQAINHQSFRYTAARLCYSVEQESPTFRAQLHLTCERELNSNSNKQGIVLFVAELYTQLHHENIYGRFLLNAFKQLLLESGDNNIKCVCQALKLTGTALELYDKEALDDIMDMLNNSRQYASGTALCLVDIVMKLRNVKWGYNSQESSGSNSEQEAYWDDDVNTVFYNSDGNMLSNEETEFLAANLQSTDEYFLDPSEDPDELCDPEPEMDEEIQAAFKEFVKLGRR